MEVIIQKLDELESHKGWSECDVAAKLGIDYSYYYRIKRGLRGIGPKFIGALIKLCEQEKMEFKEFLHIS